MQWLQAIQNGRPVTHAIGQQRPKSMLRREVSPNERRKNLITVPTCRLHNNENSPDVEYIGNVLVCGANLGPEALARSMPPCGLFSIDLCRKTNISSDSIDTNRWS